MVHDALFVALGRVSVPVAPSTRHLNILSITMGLVNYGAHMCVRVSTLVDVCVRAACLTGVWGLCREDETRGIQGNVTLGSANLTTAGWTQQIALEGERKAWFDPAHMSSAPWNASVAGSIGRRMTWLHVSLDTPSGTNPVALDMGGMGKVCAAVCGCVWLCVRLCVAVCGCVWLCVAVCGCVWLCVAVCGCVCSIDAMSASRAMCG